MPFRRRNIGEIHPAKLSGLKVKGTLRGECKFEAGNLLVMRRSGYDANGTNDGSLMKQSRRQVATIDTNKMVEHEQGEWGPCKVAKIVRVQHGESDGTRPKHDMHDVKQTIPASTNPLQ